MGVFLAGGEEGVLAVSARALSPCKACDSEWVCSRLEVYVVVFDGLTMQRMCNYDHDC